MDVFVIPLGRDRYELYSEQPVELDDSDTPSSGVVSRMLRRFSAWLRDTEERQRSGDREAQVRGWLGRQQDRALAWVVERIAEQRLLWNLRGRTSATASHPQDMTFEEVITLIKAELKRDFDRHRKWLVIDGIALLFSAIVLGPLFLIIPGVANLPAAYFAFRVVGHYLSMRGARQGLDHITWTGRPCPPLAELRDVAALAPGEREARIQDISSRLRLEHLPTFFERMILKTA
jgi:hypothetical protein